MSGTITVTGRKIDAEVGSTIENEIRKAGMVPDAFLYLKDGRPVPMDTPIEDGIQIKAIKVASGG
ncbi:MAG: hypothetical protein MJZ68_02970 [archaeon]|nr:hypothetical protein [archaeon]